MDKAEILEGADAFRIGDGPVAALLLHGFTSSPQNMRPLGDYLAGRGIAVIAPRFPGHGTTWQDLDRHGPEDWYAAAETALFDLVDRDRTFLVGLSFGASVALDLAARHPDRVAGVVALAPFVMSKDPRRFVAPAFRRVIRSVPGVGNDIADPDMREIVYDRVPTGAAHRMLGYVRKVRRRLSEIHCPLLVMHSRSDHTAHPANASLVHASVSSEDKEIVWLERSYHVISIDIDRDEVFRRTYDFIEQRSRHAV